MGSILMIAQILGVIIKYIPDMYHIFCEILAAVKPTAETGNAGSVAVAKSTAKAILPMLPAEGQAEMNGVLSQTQEQYDKFWNENPNFFAGA